jgi:hypothetical protein
MGDAVRLTGGAGRQRGPVVSNRVREEKRKARQRDGGAPIGGPGPHSAGVRFKLGFKLIKKYSNSLNFGWFKRYLSAL